MNLSKTRGASQHYLSDTFSLFLVEKIGTQDLFFIQECVDMNCVLNPIKRVPNNEVSNINLQFHSENKKNAIQKHHKEVWILAKLAFIFSIDIV